MPPRKKPTKASTTTTSSGSKKSNQTQQQQQSSQKPTKFGIQHFFDRHTQNTQKQQPTTTVKLPPPNHSSTSNAFPVPNQSNSTTSHLGIINPKHNNNDDNNNNVGVKNTSQSTPTEDLIPVVVVGSGNQLDVSPEFSKSLPRKRVKFSPGMLIDQSQDDGGDEVTWRISPVNERLHALTKNLVDGRKVLKECSRFNVMKFKQSSDDKACNIYFWCWHLIFT
ncbi:hypothetical protein M8C21_005296 [Ambrosia artemisiifolia]|uniref:Uncharacterized protein n=1 Tax=Ambrosia artemisiifolia TaxID=4212 RepID=A0AAD5CH02_AMBAR|nr:hypothetical protein M8C21_005296 [Ambrosia artemisiifolia]